MQRKTKRKVLNFIGFISVIAIISAGASGYFFHRHMAHVLQRYAFMIKSEGLMLKERGEKLKELGAAVSSYAKSESSRPPLSSHAKELIKYAEEVQKNGEKLEHYAGKLISDIQAEDPQDVLATKADLQLFIPENMETIKKQMKKIQGLEKAAMKHKSRIQELQFELDNCRTQPKRLGLYPPKGNLEDQQGSSQPGRQ